MRKKRKTIALENYGLSKHRKKELREFCLQYQEWHDEKNALYNTIGGVSKGDVTSDSAIKIIELDKKIELVRHTAIEAAPEIYRYILKNVTEEIRYEDMGVPCGRRQFYNTVKYFFCLLNKKK